MGDRRQVIFEFGAKNESTQLTEPSIILYTHWGGSALPHSFARAINAAKPRWDDESYCARIIVSQLIGERWDTETGYGLAPYLLDSEYTDFYVNLPANTVRLGPNGAEQSFTAYVDPASRMNTDKDSDDDEQS